MGNRTFKRFGQKAVGEAPRYLIQYPDSKEYTKNPYWRIFTRILKEAGLSSEYLKDYQRMLKYWYEKNSGRHNAEKAIILERARMGDPRVFGDIIDKTLVWKTTNSEEAYRTLQYAFPYFFGAVDEYNKRKQFTDYSRRALKEIVKTTEAIKKTPKVLNPVPIPPF